MTRGQLWQTLDRAAGQVGEVDFVDSAWARGQTIRRRRQALTGAAVVGGAIGAVLLAVAVLGGGTDSALDLRPAETPTHPVSPTDAPDGADASGVSVRTLAGQDYELKSVDGVGPDARFSEIRGIAVAPSGTVYVSEYSKVRMLTPDGVVTTLTEEEGTPSPEDVNAGLLGFHHLTVGPDGTVYVVDGRDAIRRVTPDGTISDVAETDAPQTDDGSGPTNGTGSPFTFILGITVDLAGTLYVADNGWVRTVTADGQVRDVGACAQPTHTGACGELAVDADGMIHFRTDEGYLVRTMTPDGQVRTLAGGDYGTSSVGPGQARDGVGTEARLGRMNGFAFDPIDSTIYIADWSGLRNVAPDGTVSTVGGSTGLVDDHDTPLIGQVSVGAGPRARHMQRQAGPIAIAAGGTLYAAVPGAILTIQGL